MLVSVVKVVALLMMHTLKYEFQIKLKNECILKKYLISGEKETRFLVQHKSCKCKWELNESVCNSK